EFLQQLKPVAPNVDLTFSTPSKYLDAVLPGVKSGKLELPTMRGGTAFSFNAFWIQNPRVKQAYRRCEQQLQAAEKLATIASLKAGFAYPVDPLYHAWLLMLLNMDRNTLSGAAGVMVFEHPTSWDASDRFATVEKISNDALTGAMHKLASTGQTVTLFNPLNWDREDPVAGMGKMKLSGLAFHPLSADRHHVEPVQTHDPRHDRQARNDVGNRVGVSRRRQATAHRAVLRRLSAHRF
ncbi:MAG: hypothetical protein NT049_14475, partial [Planctomycetota bacterium]|nr:hypothetical protein [Planctomycetota bacterium]